MNKVVAPDIVNNFLNRLSREDLIEIASLGNNKLGGDRARLAYKFERDTSLDRWLRNAESANDWYDMVDSVVKAASKRIER